MNRRFAISFALFAIASQFGQAVPGLRTYASRRHFLIGSAMPISMLDGLTDGQYPIVAAREFNLIEPENDFKMASFWGGLDQFDWTRTDFLLGAPGKTGWAQANRMKVRGHVLVYASDSAYGTPDWLKPKLEKMSRTQVRELLHQYIRTVVGRYRGKIQMWDVANEAIDDSPNSRPFNLRDSIWYRKLGARFLVDAFTFAHEADPKAELYYNDYAIEYTGRKADDALALVKWIKKQGAPVTGIGMQWHVDVNTSVNPGDGFYTVAKRTQDNGFAFMVTELDVSMPVVQYPSTDARFGLEPVNPSDLDRQAAVYKSVLTYALSFPNCHGVNIWGMSDSHSWIPWFTNGTRGAATLYDHIYTPKAAYNAVKKVLSSP